MSSKDPFAKVADFEADIPAGAVRGSAASEERKAIETLGFAKKSVEPVRREYFREPGGVRASKMNVSLRVRVEDWNLFKQFCDENRFETAGRGFEELLKLIK